MARLCQGPDCHTYDTTDRKRGPKGNKRNQTRTIGTYSYGNGNFCTLNCQNDWWALHGNQACLLYTSPSPRDGLLSRMPSAA